jgi:hypothetical protein
MDNRKPDKYKKQSASKVKPHESGRLNSFYTNITLNGMKSESCKLVESVPYLWVYNDKEEIIIGVEDPLKYPQAFVDPGIPIQKAAFDKIKPSLFAARKLGHPTLASHFDDKGAALTDRGQAYIGGELICENGKWILNNVSGRYGKLKNKPKDVQRLMHEVGNKLSAALGVQVMVNVTLAHAKYLKAYNKIWKKGSDDVERAMLLLQDYAKSNSAALTFTGHWDRKHIDLVRNIFKEFEEFPPHDVQDILIHFSLALDGVEVSETSSLLRRLKFIAEQTKSDFKIGETSGLVDGGSCDQLLIPDPVAKVNPEKGKEELDEAPRNVRGK